LKNTQYDINEVRLVASNEYRVKQNTKKFTFSQLWFHCIVTYCCSETRGTGH